MKSIETNYNGFRFRSRTEARWAVFFNQLPLKYIYERDGVVLNGSPYLPDFWLPEIGFWLEVKSDNPTEEEIEKCKALHA